MATTTNYAWETPDDTDLVKDGAAAIRTLGSSIDTTTKALNPGTTAGDLDYYTSSTAKSRIGIGSSGQVLTVSGGVPAWATPAAGGGFTLLSTTNITAVSTISITSINQTYKHLFVTMSDFTTNTTADSINLNPKSSGGTAINAQCVEMAYNGTNPPSGGGNFYGGQLKIAQDINSSTGAGANVNGTSFWIYNYAQTFQKSIVGSYGVYGVTSGNYRTAQFGGSTYAANGALAISTLDFATASGTAFRATGAIRIWGVN